MYYLFIFTLFLLSLPLQMIISVCIFLDSGYPVLFKQIRIGVKNKPFVMFKFRTMVIGSEKIQHTLKEKNEADGPVFKIRNDPRFTRIGRFLSHTGFDELPQLWNVLIGDMALIGPRPLPLEEASKLTLWQKKRHAVKPGIISPWILDGYHSKPFNTWMRSDIDYTKKKSFIYDLRICLWMIPYLWSLTTREIINPQKEEV